jgi:hypothetical protein
MPDVVRNIMESPHHGDGSMALALEVVERFLAKDHRRHLPDTCSGLYPTPHS